MLRIHKAVKKLLGALSSIEEQGSYYDSQRLSLQELRIQPGYKHIIDYLNIEADNAMSELSNFKTPKELIPYYQAKYNTTVGLLDRFDNVTAE